MKRLIMEILLFSIAYAAFAGEVEKRESDFHLGVDVQTKYVWRGMEMMTTDASPVVFPQINYQNGGLYVYVLGATALNGKYSEVDMGVSYTYKWLTVGLNDYYYPTVDSPFDRYFNYTGPETGHWLEGMITVAPERVPVYLTVSNFFAGADKTLDGKQAYSTYMELGGHYDFLNDHRLSMAVGAALNKSCYNAYAHQFGVCNIELKYTYNFIVGSYTLPFSTAFIVNPVFNKTFVNFTASLAL
jgi:hypothetical protein